MRCSSLGLVKQAQAAIVLHYTFRLEIAAAHILHTIAVAQCAAYSRFVNYLFLGCHVIPRGSEGPFPVVAPAVAYPKAPIQFLTDPKGIGNKRGLVAGFQPAAVYFAFFRFRYLAGSVSLVAQEGCW